MVAGRAVVGDLPDLAGAGGDHRRAAGGEHVLPVVPAAAAEAVGSRASEVVRAADREDVGEQLDLLPRRVALEPHLVAPLRREAAVDAAVPGHGVAARLRLHRQPPDHRVVIDADHVDAHGAAAGRREGEARLARVAGEVGVARDALGRGHAHALGRRHALDVDRAAARGDRHADLEQRRAALAGGGADVVAGPVTAAEPHGPAVAQVVAAHTQLAARDGRVARPAWLGRPLHAAQRRHVAVGRGRGDEQHEDGPCQCPHPASVYEGVETSPRDTGCRSRACTGN